MSFQKIKLTKEDIVRINRDIELAVRRRAEAWYLGEALDLHADALIDADTGDYLVLALRGIRCEDSRIRYHFMHKGVLYFISTPLPFGEEITIHEVGALDEQLLDAIKIKLTEGFKIYGFQGEGDVDGAFAKLTLRVER